jgi:zinc and cadmium transporter
MAEFMGWTMAPDTGWLIVYCAAILGFSLMGGYLPFRGSITHDRLQMYLSVAAGVMLGAAFFHLMPDALERCGDKNFGWWISLGAIGTFCIERFIAPHSHEMDGHGHHHHHHGHDEACFPNGGGTHRAASPSMSGWMAILGLYIHTFMNGVGLAGSVQSDTLKGGTIGFWGGAVPPGFILFLAIVLHKPADALAISTVLSRKKSSRLILIVVQFGFALMAAAGVIAFQVTAGHIQEALRNQLIGAALAFSSGTFLLIALSDLLPEVQFHRHDRVPLFVALLSGLLLMAAIAYLEPEEKERDHEPATEQKANHDSASAVHSPERSSGEKK